MNYYISDLHIGHANAINLDQRPFKDLDEMNEAIFTNWNARVRADDTVYILGDFIWKKESEWAHYIAPLTGNKVLIRGNHDPKEFSSTTKRLLQSITNLKEIVDGDRHVVMCHYPMPFFRNGFSPSTYMLYGHVHKSIEYEYIKELRKTILPCSAGYGTPNGHFINVGAMMPYMDYTPRTLDEIIAGDEAYRQTDEFLNSNLSL